MQNLFDYLAWRGDLNFEVDGFNEVDNLILALLAYAKMDKIARIEPGFGSLSLGEIVAEYTEQAAQLEAVHRGNPFFQEVARLFGEAARRPRFCAVRVSNYVNEIDYKGSKQFAAVVFSLDSRQHYIAFRGTDSTFAGWKEDFMMSFSETVPAQRRAVEYTRTILNELNGQFFLGGHSKGGNLAVFAASHLDDNELSRIARVFNNDGPGFLPAVTESPGYQKIIPKVSMFLPRSSVVGLLLEHSKDYRVVESYEKQVMQHDAFSWGVVGSHFIYGLELSNYSQRVNRLLRAWLSQIPREQRMRFVDALFEVISAAGAMSFQELPANPVLGAYQMIRKLRHMDDETKAQLKRTVSLFIRENRNMFRSVIKEDLDHLTAKSRVSPRFG